MESFSIVYERKLHAPVYKFAAQYAKGKILDAACGSGYGADFLSSKGILYGLDNDPAAIEEAKKHGSYFGIADLTKRFPYEDGFFDTVISIETIEHFLPSMQEPFVRELKRVAKPDATIIISTPDHNVNNMLGIYIPKHEGHGHPGERTFEEMYYLLRQHFSRVECFGRYFVSRRKTVRDTFVNFAKRVDILNLRRLLISQATRDAMNSPKNLLNWSDAVAPLTGRAAQLVFVVSNSSQN